jgi:hypothetical protein
MTIPRGRWRERRLTSPILCLMIRNRSIKKQGQKGNSSYQTRCEGPALAPQPYALSSPSERQGWCASHSLQVWRVTRTLKGGRGKKR